MPTYEYQCESCSFFMEKVQSIKDDPLSDCPHCNKNCLKRLISVGGGFTLKGGGWYKDLYSSTPSK
jgi:putative FmdB family regulatory protein